MEDQGVVGYNRTCNGILYGHYPLIRRFIDQMIYQNIEG